jgi:hypothetical protein
LAGSRKRLSKRLLEIRGTLRRPVSPSCSAFCRSRMNSRSSISEENESDYRMITQGTPKQAKISVI